MTRQRAYQLRHMAAGLCVGCSRRTVYGRYCARCHAAVLARYPAKWRCHCGVCGKRGHTRKVCPQARRAGAAVP